MRFENNENYDFSRIHLVVTNDSMGEDELKKLENKDFGDEKFVVGSECLYMYLPKTTSTKRLNTNYLEKQLSITMTMRKLNVVEHLVGLCGKIGGMEMEFYKALVGEKSNKKNIFSDLIGEWDIEWVDGKGTENERHVIGEWIFSEILNGDGIQDIFICPSRQERIFNPQPDAEYGTTIRVFNPKKQKWDICYTCLGKMVYLEAEKVGDKIVLTNLSNDKDMNLWVFDDISPSKFHWENKTSFDNGKTWITNGEVFAKKR